MFTCNNRRRYNRERASQNLGMIQFIYPFASLVVTQLLALPGWSADLAEELIETRGQQRKNQ